MKRLMSVLLLAFLHVVPVKANLKLLYPIGGEKLPGNGRHTILWTNSASLGVTVYLDWYNTNGTLIVSDNFLYSKVLDAGTNSLVLTTPARYPTNNWYKVRLVGTNSSVNVTTNSGYVYITGPADFTGQLNGSGSWKSGQTRTNTVSWSGFQSNDHCLVILESPNLHKGDYGFLLTNFVMTSQNGTQSFVVPYPSSAPAAYPGTSYSLVDGPHSFVLMNERCGIIRAYGSVDIATVGLRMSLGANNVFSIGLGDSAICSSIFLNTASATGSVSVTKVKIIFTSYATNTLSLKFTLKDGSTSLRTNTLNFNPSSGSQYSTQVDFPISLTISAGQVKELTLVCEVLAESSLGSFIWDTDAISGTIQSGMDATYTGGASIGKAVIPSFSSYINVVSVMRPKFYSVARSGTNLTFSVLTKPQVSYEIQSSTNMTSWTDLYTTNSAGDLTQIILPIQGENKFFRLREN